MYNYVMAQMSNWASSAPHFSASLKLDGLQRVYPSLPLEELSAAFAVNNHSFDKTIAYLKVSISSLCYTLRHRLRRP